MGLPVETRISPSAARRRRRNFSSGFPDPPCIPTSHLGILHNVVALLTHEFRLGTHALESRSLMLFVRLCHYPMPARMWPSSLPRLTRAISALPDRTTSSSGAVPLAADSFFVPLDGMYQSPTSPTEEQLAAGRIETSEAFQFASGQLSGREFINQQLARFDEDEMRSWEFQEPAPEAVGERCPLTRMVVTVTLTEVFDGSAVAEWPLGRWPGLHLLAAVDVYQVLWDAVGIAGSLPTGCLEKLVIGVDLRSSNVIVEGVELLKDHLAELHAGYDKERDFVRHPFSGKRIRLVV